MLANNCPMRSRRPYARHGAQSASTARLVTTVTVISPPYPWCTSSRNRKRSTRHSLSRSVDLTDYIFLSLLYILVFPVFSLNTMNCSESTPVVVVNEELLCTFSVDAQQGAGHTMGEAGAVYSLPCQRLLHRVPSGPPHVASSSRPGGRT